MLDFASLPRRGTPLKCQCGAERVDWSDIAAYVGGWLVVHGALMCYRVHRGQ